MSAEGGRKAQKLAAFLDSIERTQTAGLDLNPLDWAAAAAEGVIGKAQKDLAPEARKVERAARDFREGRNDDDDDKPRPRPRQRPRVTITAETMRRQPAFDVSIWVKMGDVWNAIPSPVKIGGAALAGLVAFVKLRK